MIDVIINPTSGNGRGRRVGAQIAAALKDRTLPHTLHETARPGHAVEIARSAAARGAKTVLAVGGDGTAFEVASGVADTQTALGVIPAGTGNDFIKAIGVPSKPLEALEHALTHAPRPTDMGRLDDHYFLNECGTGFDVTVLDHALHAKKFVRGMLPYLYGVVMTIFHYRPTRVTLTLESGEVRERPVLVVGVANGGFIGGGLRIAPTACVDDGLLDVVIVNDMPRRRLPLKLVGLLTGKVLDFPETEHFRCRAIALSGAGMRLNIDGEITPVERAAFSIAPGVLLVHR